MYKLSDAVTLFVNQTTVINSLWGIYVAATFAAAGFGATSNAHVVARAAITFGFWAFTLGHLRLITDALVTTKLLGSAITKTIDIAEQDSISVEFAELLKQVAGKAKTPWISVAIHLFIDLCVTTAIWTPFLLR